MRESITLYEGEFGRLAVMKGVKGWVTHAHRVNAIVLWLDGETGDITIGDRRVRPGPGVAIGINALQPHSHEIPPGAEEGQLIAIYLEPDWLWQRYGIEANAPFFADPSIAIAAGLRERAVELVGRLALPEADRHACLGGIEELIDELVGSVRSASRGDGRVAGGLRPIDPRIHRAIELMESNVSRRICFDSLAAEVGLSRPHFFALFKEQMEVTPNVYWNMLRASEACRMLRQAENKMYALAVDLGFTTEGNFSRFFRYHVGVPPVVYRSAVSRNVGAEPDAGTAAPIEQVTQRIRDIEGEIERLKQEVTRLREIDPIFEDKDFPFSVRPERLN
jgi:AraC-like DNA-binding protein